MSHPIVEFPSESDNPCIRCGVCCTHFRISFYWAEADDAPNGWVPAALTEPLNPWLRCMKGSNGKVRRCIALEGKVGEAVRCAIYPNRPSPCREFPVYLEEGTPNPKCNELRAQVGLPPLPTHPVNGANDPAEGPGAPPSAPPTAA
jgi:Fe-S-cluster containining protein